MFKRMFLLNQWLWFHILGATGIYGLAFNYAFKYKYIGMTEPSAHYACIWVLLSAFGWEVIEFVWKKYIKKNLEATYGTAKDWFLDTAGDIIGGLLAMFIMTAFIVLLLGA